MYQKFDGSPYSIRQLRRDNPNISFPASFPRSVLEAFGCREVVTEPAPAYDPRTQRLVRNDPTLIGDVWTITYSVVAMSQAEQLAWHRTRTLDADHFEYFLIESGLDDVFEAVLARLVAAGTKSALAKVRAFIKRDEFQLGRILDIRDRIKPVADTLDPVPDLRTITLITAWDVAEAVDLT